MQKTLQEKRGYTGFIGLLRYYASRNPEFLDKFKKSDSEGLDEIDRKEIERLRQLNPKDGIRLPSVIKHNSLYDLPTQTVVHVGKTDNNQDGIEEYEVKGKEMISLEKLFTTSNEVFIGFGAPNVFTVMPKIDKGYEKLDAFMFFRKKAQISRADQVQSGIYIRLRSVSSEMLSDLRESMKTVIGKRNISCAKSNVDLLNKAGFTSGGNKLGEISPFLLFRRIVVHGLEYEGRKLHFDILNTTPRLLEEHFDKVIKRVISSPFRAVGKSCCSDDRRGMSKKDIASIKRVLKTEPTPPIPDFDDDLTHTATYRSSRPSKFGVFVRKLTGAPHIIHEIVPDADLKIDDYLPNILIDKYHREEKVKGFFNKAKSVAFSKPVVKFLLKHLATEFDMEQEFTAKQLLDMLPLTIEREEPFRQNIVICGSRSKCGSRVVITPVKMGNSLADWILTKHLILSGYDGDVRFAGEGWGERFIAEGGVKIKIHITGESGSYTPESDQVNKAAEFLQALVGERAEIIAHCR
jgi:hypothetical protein